MWAGRALVRTAPPACRPHNAPARARPGHERNSDRADANRGSQRLAAQPRQSARSRHSAGAPPRRHPVRPGCLRPRNRAGHRRPGARPPAATGSQKSRPSSCPGKSGSHAKAPSSPRLEHSSDTGGGQGGETVTDRRCGRKERRSPCPPSTRLSATLAIRRPRKSTPAPLPWRDTSPRRRYATTHPTHIRHDQSQCRSTLPTGTIAHG